MSADEHLNEEKYQKTNRKLKRAGSIMMIIGGLMLCLLIVGIVTQIASFSTHRGEFNPLLTAVAGFAGVFGLPILAIGAYLRFVIANGRNITSYFAQQQMPIAKEGIEKATPVVGKAAGSIAKEISKGIQEGKAESAKGEEEPKK